MSLNQVECIEAREIKPGMYIFNRGEKPPYDWSRVQSVHETTTVYSVEGGEWVSGAAIQVNAGCSRVFHPREGVTIRRGFEDDGPKILSN